MCIAHAGQGSDAGICGLHWQRAASAPIVVWRRVRIVAAKHFDHIAVRVGKIRSGAGGDMRVRRA